MTRKLFLLLALLTMIPAQAYASIDGINKAGTSCGGCHGAASTAVTTTLSGPLTLSPGATGTFTALISPTVAGGPVGVGAGINVALAGLAGAALGTTLTDTNTKIVSSQLEHTNGALATPPPTNRGDWSYDFKVTAPLSLGTILINAVMNAFDGDGTEDGDLWAKVQFSVQVVPELSTVVLLGSGIAGLAAIGRRRS